MQWNAKECNYITNNAPHGGPKLVRQCPPCHQMAPSWPQHGARTTQFEFTVARIRVYSCTNPCLHPPWAPKWIKDLPNRRQDGAKHAQVGPKLVENGPKMAPVGSKFAKFNPKLIQSGFKWTPKLHEDRFLKT